MRNRFLTFAAVVVLALSAAPNSQAGKVLDGIVATVNNYAILQSDWEDAVRYEAFIAGRGLNQYTDTDKKAALDRLIDQELLRGIGHPSDFQPLPNDEIGRRLQEIRRLYPRATSDDGWQAVLGEWQLTEKQLRSHVVLELNLLRLVDARLRPNIHIDGKSVESYYTQELLPQLRRTKSRETPLAEVAPRIKELLTQEKMNQMLAAWLLDLRAASKIRVSLPNAESELR